MNLTRIIYHLRSLAAELEKIQPALASPRVEDHFADVSKMMNIEPASPVQEPVDIFAGMPAEDEAEKTPAVAIPAPAGAIIRRHWTNRRHAVYTPEETAFIAKCRETGDNPQTISDKVERRFGFRVSVRAIRHRIAKIEGREAV